MLLTRSDRRRGPAAALVAASALALWAAAAAPATASVGSPSPTPAPSSSSAADPAATNITFGIGPATSGKVDRRSGFGFLAPRGGTVSDTLALVNLTYKPLTLNLYPADAVNGPDGTLSLATKTAKATDSAAWITLKTPTGKFFVVVPPRSTVIVPFTMTVPKNAFIGDHLAGIAASIVTQGQTPGDRTTDVQFEQRIATRVAMRVAGPLKPELTIENLSAQYVGSLNPVGKGTALVTYTLHNTGNLRLGGRQEIRIHGLVGPDAKSENLPDIPLLLPGASAKVTAEVPGVLPLFWMTADVNVVALAPPTDADPVIGLATASTHFWAIPWAALGLILLLALLAGWWWRRRSVRPEAPVGRRETGAVPDAQQPLVGSSSSSFAASENPS